MRGFTMDAFTIESCEETSACRQAAVRAYEELRDRGVIDHDAFDAAVRVFQHHHPAELPRKARFIVADWIAPDA